MTEQIRVNLLALRLDVLNITESHSPMLPLRHRYTYVERESTQLLPYGCSGASFPRNRGMTGGELTRTEIPGIS